jgi:predicted aspartyl protease
MRYVQGNHDGRAAIIRVAVIDAAKYRKHQQPPKSVIRGVKPYNALIDTGASCTMISLHVARELNLEPVTKKPFASLGGTIWTMAYLFHVAFYDTSFKSSLHSDDGDQHTPEDQATQLSKIHVYNQAITGGEIASETSFDVLLGMDIITTGRLVVDKDGTFAFAFE